MVAVTKPLRDEHLDLLPRIEMLRTLADRIGEIEDDDLHRELYEVHSFLTTHLEPHAVAEDRVLYPAVARLMGAPAATATMSRDHVEVVRMTEELGGLRVRIAEGPPTPDDEKALRRVLYGLHALVQVHFAEEEDVLLPILDANLSPGEAREMFEAMEAVEKDIRRAIR